MESAVLDTVTIDVENSGCIFKTGGQVVKSVGFMAIYEQSADDYGDDEHENMSKLPSVDEGVVLESIKVELKQHYTEPPARYTEASLIKFLEENGIGRPSTYAPIISIIISRDYVRREGKVLVGTQLGEITTNFMKKHFPEIVDYEFTAGMESGLDDITNSENTIVGLIGNFYKTFEKQLKDASNLKAEKVSITPAADVSEYNCPKCGKTMVYNLLFRGNVFS